MGPSKKRRDGAKEAVMAVDPKPDPGNEPDPDKKPDPSKPATGDDVEAMKAALKKANREAGDARAKLQAIEDRDKSEAQVLADRAAAAEKRADEAEARVIRAEVAHAKGLTPRQASRLVGTTREELEADAADLLDTINPKKPDDEGGDDKNGDRPNPTNRPTEQLRGGGDPTQRPDVDLRKMVEGIPR